MLLYVSWFRPLQLCEKFFSSTGKDSADLKLGRGQFPLAPHAQAFDHARLFFDVERTDLEEALVDDVLVESAAAYDATDVVLKDAHRPSVGRVGREDDVYVFRPRLRQPREARAGDGRPEMIEAVDEHNQRPLFGQSRGDLLQRRREVLAKTAVRVHATRLVDAVHLCMDI